MPTIVIPNIIPHARCVNAIAMPPTSHQTSVKMAFRHPDCLFSLQITSDPNGHKASPASLKVWIPNGIPITVRHISRLETMYSRAIIHPPKIPQIRLNRRDTNDFTLTEPSGFIYYCSRVEAAGQRLLVLASRSPFPLSSPLSSCFEKFEGCPHNVPSAQE